MSAIPFREILPALLPLAAPDVLLVPEEFVSLHKVLSEGFCSRPERKSGGDIACGTALHHVKPFHVRRTLILIPIGRIGIRESDHRPSYVFVKVSLKVERDPERRLLVAEKADPACDLMLTTPGTV